MVPWQTSYFDDSISYCVHMMHFITNKTKINVLGITSYKKANYTNHIFNAFEGLVSTDNN